MFHSSLRVPTLGVPFLLPLFLPLCFRWLCAQSFFVCLVITAGVSLFSLFRLLILGRIYFLARQFVLFL